MLVFSLQYSKHRCSSCECTTSQALCQAPKWKSGKVHHLCLPEPQDIWENRHVNYKDKHIHISQIYAVLTYTEMQSIPVQFNWVGLSMAVYPLSKFFLVFVMSITHLPHCSPHFRESPREPFVHSDMASEMVLIKITRNLPTAKINSLFFLFHLFLDFWLLSFIHLFNIYWVPTVF